MILSIGMAVDANIVIFERIQEELIKGKTLTRCVKEGFKRAFTAILDSDITTLLAGCILFFAGSGTVKGFGQTLIIGILLSMFTSLVITKMVIRLLIGIGFRYPKLYGMRIR